MRTYTHAHLHTCTPARLQAAHTRTPAHLHTHTPAHPHTRTPAHTRGSARLHGQAGADAQSTNTQRQRATQTHSRSYTDTHTQTNSDKQTFRQTEKQRQGHRHTHGRLELPFCSDASQPQCTEAVAKMDLESIGADNQMEHVGKSNIFHSCHLDAVAELQQRGPFVPCRGGSTAALPIPQKSFSCQ